MSNQALTSEDGQRWHEPLIDMIHNLGRITRRTPTTLRAIPASFAYTYTWHFGTLQIEQQIVALPAAPSGQNGSRASTVRKEWFDDRGRLAWLMDEPGRVGRYQYSKTRLVSSRVYDDIPASGWGASGVNCQETSYGYETFGIGKMGRENRILAPDGTITRLVLGAWANTLAKKGDSHQN